MITLTLKIVVQNKEQAVNFENEFIEFLECEMSEMYLGSSTHLTMKEEIDELFGVGALPDSFSMVVICANCNTEVELKDPSDVVECSNCGKEVSKENCGGIVDLGD